MLGTVASGAGMEFRDNELFFVLIGDCWSMGNVCGVTPRGVTCECIGEFLVGITWLEVLPSGCAGGCDEVAVGVPCPHGSELPGEDSWLCCV